ncbi:methionine--tRNA ligase [Halobellus limi]|uniref:Methionine--tRNA ligase n=1 Tax=Halobellus limi TaxID=699433 RepID=A0A1H5Z3N1_9EURY|nr:methionine--tRNA ligase [Halobellus limi]QCC48241.1 methionine--tRNA ligase [Halobellus limi]SEG30784.1 methionyl-tRNA synthetase [Halobellus limi]
MSHEDFPTENPAVVTCGLPYANGDLHIGHLRTYVGGDIYSRALKRLGQQTAFVSGSDMHGTPVAVNAAEEGVTPEEFALRHHETYEATFPKFDVEFDNYGQTHDETNVETTQEIVRTLEEAGYVYEKEIPVAYDPDADQWLPDRFVEGACPYCGEHARGDECDEGCGRHLEPGEIEDPVSTITGNPAEYRNREHKFFAVSDLQEYLGEFIDRLEGTSNAQNQPREWIEGELQDWCITRDMDWGVDYPGDDDLVLYVWVDAPIEYISSTKQYTERVGPDVFDWEEAWRDNGEIVHIIGRDIIQHHTVFWPAMLRGAGYVEPRAVMASGFITLEGKGFSTSRDRAVWADEYLDEGFRPDLLRYYLATNGGFQQDVDFSWGRFRERVNNELVGTVGNFVYRSLLFAAREFGGSPDVALSDDVRERIEQAIDEFEAGVNDYSVRDIGESAVRLAQFGNEYIQRNEPWKLDDDDPEKAQVIRDCVQIAKAVAVLFEPVTPEAAENLWDDLGEEGDVHAVGVDAALEDPAGEFDEPTELFEKIPEERVEELNEKLESRVAAASESDDGDAAGDDADGAGEADDGDAEPAADLEPIAEERIGFEDFQELDIRVGEILAAEGVEGADKLAKLTVDIGVEERQIVAGIKQLHDLDSLVGEKIVVVANLEKAELFGVESNGMLLAAGEEADLLTTHGDAEPGTKIR